MGYFRRGALVERFTKITTAAGTTTLTSSSTTFQVLTGSTTQTIVLPDATTCDGGSNSTGGQKFYFFNRSTGVVTINTNGGARLTILNPSCDVLLQLNDGTTAAGSWTVVGFTPQEQPLKLSANTGADSKVRISTNQLYNFDGTDTYTPPISSVIPSVATSTHDLQTGATTGATFSGATLPTATVGQYIRIGYSLLASGSIQVVYSSPAGSVGALANPGTVFVKTGLPIGWVDAQATGTNAYKTANSATAIVENMVSGVPVIHRFGSGGGGGGGTGDANQFLIELEDRLGSSYFNCLTPNIISMDGVTKVDVSSTGSYDIANNAYSLATIGQKLVSTQSYDTFLTSFVDNAQAELNVLWFVKDASATYEISRDAGLNWTTVAMTEIATTNKFRGIGVFGGPTNTSTLVTYDVANADSQEALNASTNTQLAISFTVPSGAKWRTATLRTFLNKLGSPQGFVWAQVVKDSSGQPSTATTDILCETSQQNITSLAAGNNTVDFAITQPLPAGTYWLLLKTDSSYKTSFSSGVTEVRWRVDASSPTYTGTSSRYNGTAWSTISAEAFTFAIIGITYDLRVRITSGTTNASLSGYGILYEEDTLGLAADNEEYQAFQIDGSLNTTTLTITNFNVNPRALKIYDTNNDVVYRYPKFAVNGNTITFATGTFYAPGLLFNLICEQSPTKTGYVTDKLSAVLATNGLGSTDTNFDFSSPGVGPIVQRPDGTKRMITVDNTDSIVIKSVP